MAENIDRGRAEEGTSWAVEREALAERCRGNSREREREEGRIRKRAVKMDIIW